MRVSVKPFTDYKRPWPLTLILQKALELSWTGDVRVLIQIADAPAHGSFFNDISEDEQKSFDSDGSYMRSLLQQVRGKDITYFFGKIWSNTDKVGQLFLQIISSSFCYKLPDKESKHLYGQIFDLVIKICKGCCYLRLLEVPREFFGGLEMEKQSNLFLHN